MPETSTRRTAHLGGCYWGRWGAVDLWLVPRRLLDARGGLSLFDPELGLNASGFVVAKRSRWIGGRLLLRGCLLAASRPDLLDEADFRRL